MMKNERGFTIMELLVVIVIIGVLAAIGVPAYNNMTTRAKKTACDANKRTLQTAAGMYYADHAEYPGDETTPDTWKDADDKPYIDNLSAITCPLGGEYSWDGTNKVVECSVHDNPTPQTP